MTEDIGLDSVPFIIRNSWNNSCGKSVTTEVLNC